MVPNFSACRSKIERNDCGQDGSILIAASVFLLVGVILLGSIQDGYMYYTKRELQKTADLAALTGVQSLWQGPDAAKTAAEKVAAQNFGGASVDAEPGNWTDGKFDSSLSPQNALQVVVSAPLSPIVPFFGMGSISAQAQAVTNPVAQFSVASRLLNFDSSGLLGQLLKKVGVTDTDLKILDSSGLATVGIRPINLLNNPELHIPLSVFSNVASPEALAQDTTVQLGTLLDVAADVVSRASPNIASSLLTAITDLSQVLGPSTPIPLFGAHGVLSIVQGTDPSAALSTQVNALEFIAATAIAATIANGSNSIDLNAGVPGLVGNLVSAKIVEPPALAIGGMGSQATNSQVRLALSLSSISISVLGLGVKLSPLSLQINLANSTGTLTKVCQPDSGLGVNQAEITVQSSSGEICLNTNDGCASSTYSPVAEVDAPLLGKVATVSASVEASIASTGPTPVVATVGQPVTSSPGDVDLLGTAFGNLLGNIKITALGGLLSVDTSALSAALSPLLGAALQPVGAALGTALSALGLNVDQTDVLLSSVQCASPRLVQ